MKMITAIVNKKDTPAVCDTLTDNGFIYTKIATVGGFLKAGNTTLIIGIDDEKLDEVLKIIRDNSAKRKEIMASMPMMEGSSMMLNAYPVEVEVGGATVFVTDVVKFEKM